MFFSVKVPFQKQEVADYERRRYRGIDQRIVHRREVSILKRLLRHAEEMSPASSRGGYALDAPCGYGRFSALLRERDFRPVNCDLSLAMVESALQKGYGYTIPMGIVANMTGGLPFQASAFPLILSVRFFHHLHASEDRRSVLREFARTSAGWLIVSFYQANVLHRVQRRLRRMFKRSKTRIKMITRREFKQEIGEAGFEVSCVVPLFRGIHAHHIALLKKA
jgi:SAM-dependent methyltransferase